MKVKELLEDIKNNEKYNKLDELSFIKKIYISNINYEDSYNDIIIY